MVPESSLITSDMDAQNGTIRLLRMDGRLYDRVTEEAHR